MLKLRRATVVLTACVLALGALVAFTAASGQVGGNVTVGSSLPGGAMTIVTALSPSYVHIAGQASDQPCVGLYRVQLGAAVDPNKPITLDVAWLDPQDASQVLNNPHSFIDVQIYYTDQNTSTTPCVVNIGGNNTNLYPDPGAWANAELTKPTGEVLLHPSEPEAAGGSLYVLAGIHVPGGYPPGQQPGTGSLRFNLTTIQ